MPNHLDTIKAGPSETGVHETAMAMAVDSCQAKRSETVISFRVERRTAGLRSLEALGLITRKDLSTSVLRVEYELKDTVRLSVRALLDSLEALGNLF